MDSSTVDGNTVKDASVNQNDALLEGNASVVYDETFKKNVLVLDSTDACGDANSSCARIPFNSSLYTQDAITIETAFIIDDEISDDTSVLHGSDEQHIIATTKPAATLWHTATATASSTSIWTAISMGSPPISPAASPTTSCHL